MKPCFHCETPTDSVHFPIPVRRGGKNYIYLCPKCAPLTPEWRERERNRKKKGRTRLLKTMPKVQWDED